VYPKIIATNKYYVLAEDYCYKNELLPNITTTSNELIKASPKQLLIKSSFEWDGPSGGITLHTTSFLRSSLVHDALYQLISKKVYPLSFRKLADKILKQLCLEDGMPRWRAWYVYWAVRLLGWRHI